MGVGVTPGGVVGVGVGVTPGGVVGVGVGVTPGGVVGVGVGVGPTVWRVMVSVAGVVVQVPSDHLNHAWTVFVPSPAVRVQDLVVANSSSLVPLKLLSLETFIPTTVGMGVGVGVGVTPGGGVGVGVGAVGAHEPEIQV